MNLLDVNWLAVVLGALAGFVVGGLWYGPIMGKSWMVAVGKTEEDLKEGNPAKTYGLTFLLALLASSAIVFVGVILASVSRLAERVVIARVLVLLVIVLAPSDALVRTARTTSAVARDDARARAVIAVVLVAVAVVVLVVAVVIIVVVAECGGHEGLGIRGFRYPRV